MLTIKIVSFIIVFVSGDLAQLARATGLHPVGREFESLSLHHLIFIDLEKSFFIIGIVHFK